MTNDKLKEAELLLRIHKIYSSDSMVNAFSWFYKDFHAESFEDFQEHYPLGSEGRKHFFRIGNFFDLLGTFVKRNYLPKDLIIGFCPDDVKSFWKPTKTLILQMREKWNDPRLYGDLEFLNEEIEKWQSRSEKEARARERELKFNPTNQQARLIDNQPTDNGSRFMDGICLTT